MLISGLGVLEGNSTEPRTTSSHARGTDRGRVHQGLCWRNVNPAPLIMWQSGIQSCLGSCGRGALWRKRTPVSVPPALGVPHVPRRDEGRWPRAAITWESLDEHA